MAELAVCAILSHRRIYDVEFYSNLQKAVGHLLETNDFVDIWISSTYSDTFMFYALYAVYHHLRRHPDNMMITVVTPYGEECPFCYKISHREAHPKKSESGITSHKDLMAWMMNYSTHLISCVYEGLCDEDPQIPREAYSHLEEVIDITEQGTKEALLENISQMTDKQKKVYSYVKAGYTKEDIGEIMGISPERAGRLFQKIRRELHKEMIKRYAKKIRNCLH